MPAPHHSRPIGLLRRHGIAFAALVVALSFSPLPSMAANLVTTKEIKNGAVTTPKLAPNSVKAAKIAPNSVNSGKVANATITSDDIKDGSIGTNDLNPSAKGAKVIRYDLGSLDFSVTSFLSRQLPGAWNAATVAASTWRVSMHSNGVDRDYVMPGLGVGGSTNYRLSIGTTGIVYIDKTGPGEAYTNIRIFQTVPTSSQAASARLGAPKRAQSRTDVSDR